MRAKLLTPNDFEHQVSAFNCQSEALNYNESAAVLGALALFDQSALLQDPRVVEARYKAFCAQRFKRRSYPLVRSNSPIESCV